MTRRLIFASLTLVPSFASAGELRDRIVVPIADGVAVGGLTGATMNPIGTEFWHSNSTLYRDGLSGPETLVGPGDGFTNVDLLRVNASSDVAFYAIGPEGAGIWAVPLGETTPRLIFDGSQVPPLCDAINPPGVGPFDWSPDSGGIQLSSCNHLYEVDIDGNVELLLTDGLPVEGFFDDARLQRVVDLFFTADGARFALLFVECDGFEFGACKDVDAGWLLDGELLFSASSPLPGTMLVPTAGQIPDATLGGRYIVSDGNHLYSVQNANIVGDVDLAEPFDGQPVELLTGDDAPLFPMQAIDQDGCIYFTGRFGGARGVGRQCGDQQEILARVGDVLADEPSFTVADLTDVAVAATPALNPGFGPVTLSGTLDDGSGGSSSPAILHVGPAGLELAVLDGDPVEHEGDDYVLQGPFALSGPANTQLHTPTAQGTAVMFTTRSTDVSPESLWLLVHELDADPPGDTDGPPDPTGGQGDTDGIDSDASFSDAGTFSDTGDFPDDTGEQGDTADTDGGTTGASQAGGQSSGGCRAGGSNVPRWTGMLPLLVLLGRRRRVRVRA